MKFKLYCLAIGALLLVSAIPAAAQDSLLSLGVRGASGINGSGGTVNASQVTLEYQKALGSLVSLSFSLGNLNYNYSSNDSYNPYTEKGRGTTGSIDVNFYPGRNVLHGFHLGPGIGVAALSTDWNQNAGSYYASNGSYSGTGLEVHAKLGWAIQAGNVTIDPNIQVGDFLAMPDNSDRNSATLSFYFLAGVNIGVRF